MLTPEAGRGLVEADEGVRPQSSGHDLGPQPRGDLVGQLFAPPHHAGGRRSGRGVAHIAAFPARRACSSGGLSRGRRRPNVTGATTCLIKYQPAATVDGAEDVERSDPTRDGDRTALPGAQAELDQSAGPARADAARRPRAEIPRRSTTTWGELDRRVTALAGALHQRGVGFGDRVLDPDAQPDRVHRVGARHQQARRDRGAGELPDDARRDRVPGLRLPGRASSSPRRCSPASPPPSATWMRRWPR